jgi:uncharacterized repeat protein (TIGR01451 family)
VRKFRFYRSNFCAVVTVLLAAVIAALAQVPPQINSQPMTQSAASGDNVTFGVDATGDPPLRYQWQFNGTNYPAATNVTLSLTNITLVNGGPYRVIITNNFGAVTSEVAILNVDQDLTFRLIDLLPSGSRWIEHNNLTGDDRGGIAVSPTHVVVNGDFRAASYTADTLSNGRQYPRRFDALCNNLRDEKVYTLANGETPILSNPFNFSTVNSLLEIDANSGTFGISRINLSTGIVINTSSMLFSGWDRIVIYNGSRVFNIALPSGRVTDLGNQPSFSPTFSESWARWGIAEYVNNTVFMVYVQDSRTIARRRVGSNVATILSAFQSLSDMASITFSPSRGRWFFHHEGSSQFTPDEFPDEVLGSAKGFFTSDPNYPLILTNPVSQSVYIDANAVFRVAATGGEPLEYQWLFNGEELFGATSATLLLTNVQPTNAGTYAARVTTPTGAVVSAPATLSVITTPFIVVQPTSRSVFRGSNTVFGVLADGAPPLSYQWRFDGVDLPNATNSSLFITNAQPADQGLYSIRVFNRFGSVNSANAELFVATIVDDGSVFQVTSLVTNGARTVNGTAITGTGLGSIALSSSNLFYTGFNGTGRFPAADLNGGTRLDQTYQALVSNLRTEQVYTLGNGATPLEEGGVANTLIEVDGVTGELIGSPIQLSSAITVLNQAPFFDQVGLYSGYDRIVIHNNSHVYSIAVPSGRVTDLGYLSARSHNFSQGWGQWGVAEHANGFVYLLYMQNNRTIVRTRVPDGFTTTVVQFPNTVSFYLTAMTVSVRRGRWYFEYPFGGGTFQSFNQTVGFANATFNIDSGANIDHFEWDPIFPVQSADVPFPARLTARTTSGSIASNFTGGVRLSAYDANTGAALSMVPISISGFTSGVWTGEVSVLQPAPAVVLHADDGNGNVGDSGIFSVSSTNDLVLRITDAPDPVLIGQELRYTISVTNTGPSDATGVVVSNALPTNVVFVAATSSQGTCSNAGHIVHCDLGVVPTALRVDIVVTVKPTMLGTIIAHAAVMRNETDPDPSNNAGSVSTLVSNPSLRIADVVVTEGDSGTNFNDFVVTLSSPSTNTVRVNFSTANGNATAPTDFVNRSGTLIFAPGSTSEVFSVGVRGDVAYETNETFFVNLTLPQNATIADGQAVATILNDDAPPMVSITDVSVTEGNSGTNNAVFRIGLSAPNGLPVVVRYSTSNGTARAGSDYIGRNGSVTFSPGTLFLTQSVTIQVRGDTMAESNETFYINLTSATNGVIAKGQGVGMIINDESAGVFDRFGWSSIPSPQMTDAPFLVTVSAQDFYGNLISNFNGSVTARGAIGQPQIDGTLFPPNIMHDFSEPFGPYTFGVDFTPSVDMTVTHVRHYTGNKMSIWTDQGVLLANQPVTSTAGTWTETPLSTPLQLRANTTYRLSNHTDGDNYYYSTNFPTSFDHGSIGETYYTTGDGFPIFALGQLNWMLDLRYSIGPPSIPVSINPTNIGPFSNGVWSGYVSVLQSTTNVHLEADDGQGRIGLSNPFDTLAPSNANLVVRISGTNFVHTRSNIVLTVLITNRGPAAASNVVLTNPIPADFTFVSAAPSQGSWSNNESMLICDLGVLPARTAAVIPVTWIAGATGRVSVFASAHAAETDLSPLNNSTRFTLTVYVDTDSDGIWDEFDPEPNSPNNAPTDPDDDGHTDLQEFHAGTDPRDANSVKLLTYLSVTNGEVRIGFRGKAGQSYRIEYSDSLATWNLLQDVQLDDTTNERELIDRPPALTTRFYRASRATPLPP